MTNDGRRRFTLRMPTQLYEQVLDEARKKGLTVNALLMEIVWKHVKT